MRKNGLISMLLGILLSLEAVPIYGENADEIYTMSLDELLNMNIEIASYESRPIREQPGIISIITEDEIRKSGARDLIDILNLVPGFNFAGEVCEWVGIHTRGIWANEGKVLILIDGIELNETVFGTLQFNNYFSADQIKQIEIIRGPGSAMYGGTSELAVIKITTKGREINGFKVTATPSLNKGHINQKYDLVVGKSFENWGFSIAASYKAGTRSNEELDDNYGNTYDMSEYSHFVRTPIYYNIGVNLKGLELKFIQNNHSYEMRDYYGIVPWTNRRHEINDSILASAKYTWNIGEKLTIVPKFTFKNHNAWQNYIVGQEYRWQVEGTRYIYDLLGMYRATDMMIFSGGIQYFDDKGKAHEQTGRAPETHFGNSDRVAYQNAAVFAQAEVETLLGLFTTGGRYENHSHAGDAFVPRLGLTKVLNKFHFKLLYSQAFRTPNIEIIRYNITGSTNPIRPEFTTAYEIETGYQFSDNLYWVGNAYYVAVDDAIYYKSTYYENGKGTVSTYGYETELRFKSEKAHIKLGYANYFANQVDVNPWSTDRKGTVAGNPNHKIMYSVTYDLMQNFSLNCNGFLTSRIRSYIDPDGDWVAELVDYKGMHIMNLFVDYHMGPIGLGIGVSDLLNEMQKYYPAYDNWSGAIPAMSREFFIKVSCRI